MSQIRILPAEVANRIAAGEVVERPASVVKELVENSIDAGAHRIFVQTEDGGKRLIQVDDDGRGMDPDDALLCIEAHATSKIRETADVGDIRTLGFRGEALPSISSVSRFRLRTRRQEEQAGTEVLVDNGRLGDVRDCGCAPGTSIQVRQLFGSLPARRKFLRGAATEDKHIQETVLLQALAHPDISFELRNSGREVLRVPQTTDLLARIAMLMGRESAESMLPVDYEESGIRIHGYIARPGFTRASRRDQRIFVNGRPAGAETVYRAIRDAYQTLVMKGRYPEVVLYLEMEAAKVDVNVHPAKREVRFRDPRLVGQVVVSGVTRSLRSFASLSVPDSGPHSPAETPEAPFTAPVAQAFPRSRQPLQPDLGIDRLPPVPEAPRSASPNPFPPSPEDAGERVPEPSHSPSFLPPPPPVSDVALGGDVAPPVPPPVSPSASMGIRHEIAELRILGSLRGGYLVAEGVRGLVLVDHNAAHKRIIFEEMLRQNRQKPSPSQQLLLPATVDLGIDDAKIVRRDLECFDQLGFGVEPFGGNTFLITAVPACFPGDDVASLFKEIIDDLRQGGGGGSKSPLVRVAQAACRRAVSGKVHLSTEEIEKLLHDLARAEMPYTCPDGHPVLINIPYRDLEKRFNKRGADEVD